MAYLKHRSSILRRLSASARWVPAINSAWIESFTEKVRIVFFAIIYDVGYLRRLVAGLAFVSLSNFLDKLRIATAGTGGLPLLRLPKKVLSVNDKSYQPHNTKGVLSKSDKTPAKSGLSQNDKPDQKHNPTDILSQNDKKLPDQKPHNTQKEIAKTAGVSTGQVGMAEQVRKRPWGRTTPGARTTSESRRPFRVVAKRYGLI